MTDYRDRTTQWPATGPNNHGFNYPRPGLNSLAEYQASGLPYVSQSAVSATTASCFEFPYVTSEIDIKNEGTEDLYVGFTENGVKGTNRFTLEGSDSLKIKIRCDKIYFLSATGTPTVSVLAAMTQIDNKLFPTLSGAYADSDTGKAAWITSSLDPASTAAVYGYDGLG